MFLSRRAQQASSAANVEGDERRIDSPQPVSEAHGQSMYGTIAQPQPRPYVSASFCVIYASP
jgi:hypothetical protein